MLYLLYGQDTYRRNERLQEILAQYREKHPEGLGLSVLDGESALEDLAAAFSQGGGLFEEKRFLVVRDAFAAHGTRLIESIENVFTAQGAGTNAVFVEGDTEKRAGFTDFRRLCKAEAFSPLSPNRLAVWIEAYVRARGPVNGPKAIARDALKALGSFGPDLFRLSGELEKLIAYAAGRPEIVADDIRILVQLPVEETIFPLSDGVCERDPLRALAALHRLTAATGEADGLVKYTVGEARNLVRAHAAVASHAPDTVAARFGIKPFVWRKRTSQARRWDVESVMALHQRAVELELSWKTGTDARLALERFILQSA